MAEALLRSERACRLCLRRRSNLCFDAVSVSVSLPALAPRSLRMLCVLGDPASGLGHAMAALAHRQCPRHCSGLCGRIRVAPNATDCCAMKRNDSLSSTPNETTTTTARRAQRPTTEGCAGLQRASLSSQPSSTADSASCRIQAEESERSSSRQHTDNKRSLEQATVTQILTF